MMIIKKRASLLVLVAVCLCAARNRSLGDVVYDAFPPEAYEVNDDGRIINTKTGKITPASEIGWGIPSRPDGPVAPIINNPFPGSLLGGPVVSLMPAGDSITTGSALAGDGRESYRPILWDQIKTSGPALLRRSGGTVGLDFRGEQSESGTWFWGDDPTVTSASDAMIGPNPVFTMGNERFIPDFDDQHQAGRGLSLAEFMRCGPGHPNPAKVDCDTGMTDPTPPPIEGNGFNQTIVNSARKWIDDQQKLDIVTIMLGTNNIIQQMEFEPAMDFTQAEANAVTNLFYLEIINGLVAGNPDVCIFVSEIPTAWSGPNVSRWSSDHAEVQAMNTAIDNILGPHPNVTVVSIIDSYSIASQWNPAHANTWMQDGTHPNVVGDTHIANKFFLAMEGGDPNGILAMKALAAIPEPSSFLFLGLIGLVAGGWKYFRRDQTQ